MNAAKISIATLLFAVLAMTAFAAQVPVTVNDVKFDDTSLVLSGLNQLSVERGETYEVRVQVTPFADMRNTEIRAYISGYEFSDVNDIEDHTDVFDAKENVTYIKKLNLRIPDDVERDSYKLRIVISDRFNDELTQDYDLQIDVPRNAVSIKDVVYSPSGAVRAGSALLAKVRIENKGEKDQTDVRVTVNVPGLGLSGTQYIDKIDNGDSQEETEEIFLRIPKCAKPGNYNADVEVEYQDRHYKVSDTSQITVLEDDTCNQDAKAVSSITLGNQLQNVLQGGTVVFPVTITNAGKTSKTFTIEVPSQDWAAITVTPTSTLVVPSGQTTTVFVNAQISDETPIGAHALVATVISGKDAAQQLTMTANVQKGPVKASAVLEVILVILVALLVILGIAIGISHVRGKEQTEAYY